MLTFDEQAASQGAAKLCHSCRAAHGIQGSGPVHLAANNMLGKEPRAQCEECGKWFPSMARVKVHLLRHKKGKAFKCDKCPKEFVTKGELQAHSNVHEKKNNYLCVDCGAWFSYYNSLKFHRRSVHTNERPFKCDYCDKGFTKSYALTRHRRQHTGEKPYKCEVCGKGSADHSTHKRHMRKVHKLDSIPASRGGTTVPQYDNNSTSGHNNATTQSVQLSVAAPSSAVVSNVGGLVNSNIMNSVNVAGGNVIGAGGGMNVGVHGMNVAVSGVGGMNVVNMSGVPGVVSGVGGGHLVGGIIMTAANAAFLQQRT